MLSLTKAKSSWPKLVRAVEKGHEPAILILRNGQPAAQLVPMDPAPTRKWIGVAKGKM
ncbi:type II toxin-antitoxin system Phd/YefM family antitoxin [Alcaligenes faecalis]|uniref:Type II toxin-antitoxin system Phd/YefM family antitoxin n=1 Tax=Alcaligenes faecalis TaxID=511 RepID=A0AAE9KMT6_ALCFA|nr:type II toxin-antitoxin system Phd/YefM family antitoxin [Alcaligenes faecalis]UPL21017.1 type II toxin-antitoxin system Phd/YefM family antitoxin [Alcaligenes faecalis]